MTDREICAGRLADAVGQIDETYIDEAMNYRPKFRLPGYAKALITAASILLAIGLTVSIAAVSRFLAGMSASGNAALSVRERMIGILLASDAEARKTVPRGGTALIWQTDDGFYRTVPISEKAANAILNSVESENAAAAESTVRIWVRTENGLCQSPELLPSPGNTDITMFDYSPETVISERTAKLIINALKEG